MADISPFRALRYNSSKVSPGDVMTQPYDKITPAMQDKYYQSSPYNLVQVILGKQQPGDNDQQNVYTRAAACCRNGRTKACSSPTPNLASMSTRRPSRFPAILREPKPSGADSSRWGEWRTTIARLSTGTSRP